MSACTLSRTGSQKCLRPYLLLRRPITDCQQVLEYHCSASLPLVGTTLECILQWTPAGSGRGDFMYDLCFAWPPPLPILPLHTSNPSLAHQDCLWESRCPVRHGLSWSAVFSDTFQERIVKLHLAVTARSSSHDPKYPNNYATWETRRPQKSHPKVQGTKLDNLQTYLI